MNNKTKEYDDGKNYTPEGYNMIFNMAILGQKFEDIAKMLNRSSSRIIEQCWWRLLYNGSVEKYEKEHELNAAFQYPHTRLKPKAKEFIKIQYTDPRILSTIESLSIKIGAPVDMIEKQIIKSRWNKLRKGNINKHPPPSFDLNKKKKRSRKPQKNEITKVEFEIHHSEEIEKAARKLLIQYTDYAAAAYQLCKYFIKDYEEMIKKIRKTT